MTFDEWLDIGITNRWALPTVCATHDGIPESPEEEALRELGDDPCALTIRVCEPHQWQAIYDNTNSMEWRYR